jgi:hypothetical protein
LTTCVISQPRLFPGLHYLHRMMVADIFVILDTVQFSPRHEENRARLKGPLGPHWLTVPMTQVSREQLICDTRVAESQPWQQKAIRTLANFYGQASCYSAYADEVNRILAEPHETLTQLARASWQPALRLLGISCRFVCASALPVAGSGSNLLVDICEHLGADTYLSGAFGKDYLDLAAFAAVGVAVNFHDYRYPVYRQRFGPFLPFLSYLDMLFNAGLGRAHVLGGGDAAESAGQPEAVLTVS